MNDDDDRNPLIDIAQELSSLGEEIAEGDINVEALRDRLWAASARLDPYDPQDQVRRVGVVVFCEVKATSNRDAGTVAEMAIRQQLREGTVVPTITARQEPTPVRIGEVMEVGMAAGNGYLWTRTTSKPWRHRVGGVWDGQMPADSEPCDECSGTRSPSQHDEHCSLHGTGA